MSGAHWAVVPINGQNFLAQVVDFVPLVDAGFCGVVTVVVDGMI
jgi:hypothetical protein